jgi:hypothetical protein
VGRCVWLLTMVREDEWLAFELRRRRHTGLQEIMRIIELVRPQREPYFPPRWLGSHLTRYTAGTGIACFTK